MEDTHISHLRLNIGEETFKLNCLRTLPASTRTGREKEDVGTKGEGNEAPA